MKITVLKQNQLGQETWRYQGQVLEYGPHAIILEAHFNYKKDVEIQGLELRVGDRFVETFYNDRWYNIFEIHDREDDRLKGWYCNIATPAVITNETIAYRDLALDLIVLPDGRQAVVDDDEFQALQLSPSERRAALAALEDLQAHFRNQFGAVN